MGNIGGWEIGIVLVLILIIFGPKKLPELGQSLGKSIRGFRKGLKETTDEVTSTVSEVREAAGVNDMKAAVAEVRESTGMSEMKSTMAELREATDLKGALKAETAEPAPAPAQPTDTEQVS